MNTIITTLPSHIPLPKINPLKPPEHIIALFQQHEHEQFIYETSKENDKMYHMVRQKSPKGKDYKSLYEQKCEELVEEINKNKELQEIVEKYQKENRELQIQIKKIQELKYDRSTPYRGSETRRRSKSYKKLPPTIQIRVPATCGNKKEDLDDQKQFKRSDFQEYLKLYREEVQFYKNEVNKLTEEISYLKNQLKNSPTKRDHHYSKQQSIRGHTHNNSPQMLHLKGQQNDKPAYPWISNFSPTSQTEPNTIKKDQIFSEAIQFQLKKLKNELLYKQLLLENVKEESAKENKILQKHLRLSVEQSSRVAEETAQILDLFKKQIVKLWKIIENGKIIENNYEQRQDKNLGLISFGTSQAFKEGKEDFLKMLQVRRNEQLK